MDAAKCGAMIKTRTTVTSARREAGAWIVELAQSDGTRIETVRARVLVNAAGPWVDDVLANRVKASHGPRMRLVKGSHIVVPRLFEHDQAYIFQNADRRIIFAIPYEDQFTLIGTTDVDYTGDPGNVRITAAEIEYLCKSTSSYFRGAITPASVVWSYSGVRPLLDEGGGTAQEATRNFVLERDGEPALLNICGGKITTYRRLAEAALGKFSDILAVGTPWTATAPLPGGDFAHDGLEALVTALRRAAPAADEAMARRLARTYGTLAHNILDGAARPGDLGTHFGVGLYEGEVRHLVRNEWAQTADDILWRRTKLGLRLDKPAQERLAQWLAGNATKVAVSAH